MKVSVRFPSPPRMRIGNRQRWHPSGVSKGSFQPRGSVVVPMVPMVPMVINRDPIKKDKHINQACSDSRSGMNGGPTIGFDRGTYITMLMRVD